MISLFGAVALLGSSGSRAHDEPPAPQVPKSAPSRSDRDGKLAEVGRLEAEIAQLTQQKQYREATEKAQRVVAIHEELQDKRSPQYIKGLQTVGELFKLQNDLAKAVPFFEQVAAIHKEVLGEKSIGYAADLNELVDLFRNESKIAEARQLCEKVLAIRKEVLGERHPDYATSLNNLAELHRLQGDYAGARPLCEKALAIRKAVLGERHPDYATSLNNLAMLLHSQGDYAGARPLLEQALAIRKEVLGERHPDYARSLNDLAMLLKSTGDYAGAKPLLEQALAIRKAVLGERHPDYAQSLNNLAELFYATGDYAGARPLFEKALAIRKEVLGERHPDYATSLNNLAFLLSATGDYAGARALLEQALAIRKEVLGERHPFYARSLNNLAELFYATGDYAGARPLFEKALAIRKEVLGERHPDYTISLNDLAMLLKLTGDYAGARPLFEKALAIRKAVLGERHPYYATSLDNLASLLSETGDYAGARPLLEQALAIQKEVLGERHPDYATSLNDLAELLYLHGYYAEARPLYEQALEIQKEVLGQRHPYYVRSLNNLAVLLSAMGDYAGARPLCEQALAIYKEVQGERHPNYASSLNNLALLLSETGDYAGARPLYEQALAIRKEVQGERHPSYAISLSNLAALLCAQQDYRGAAPLFEQALENFERNLDLAAAGQSERQQLAMTRDFRWALNSYLTVSPLAKLAAGSAYPHVMAAKGAVFERQRRMRTRRRMLRADPQSEAARRFADYDKAVARLATLALATPDPKQAAAWRDNVAGLSRRTDELEAELARLDAGFRSAQAEVVRTPEQLQAALPPGTALVDMLEYAHSSPSPERKGKLTSERRLVAFVVRRDRPIERIELGPMAPIQKVIDDWRLIIAAGKVKLATGDPARELRRLIWEPLEPHLVGVGSVLVSPDGPIGLIPLAALPGKQPGSYLIEERPIAVVPVPRVLGSNETGRASSQRTDPGKVGPARSLLLVGDIDYGGDAGARVDRGASRSAAVETRAGFLPNFPRLSATQAEIGLIGSEFRKRFPGAEELKLDGVRATEEALDREAPRHRFLHLATHGYFAPKELRSALGPDDPQLKRPGIDALGGAGVVGYHPGLLSGIVLAGANRRPTPIDQDDGILTASEVAELDLSGVDLAVLSACETGLGEVAGGEGLLGLQRAFQEAGAGSVVASMWQVDDERTRALMTRFYENQWGKEGLQPAAALREAQLYLLRGEGQRRSGKGEQRGADRVDVEGADTSKSDRLPPFYWAAFVLSSDRP